MILQIQGAALTGGGPLWIRDGVWPPKALNCLCEDAGFWLPMGALSSRGSGWGVEEVQWRCLLNGLRSQEGLVQPLRSSWASGAHALAWYTFYPVMGWRDRSCWGGSCEQRPGQAGLLSDNPHALTVGRLQGRCESWKDSSPRKKTRTELQGETRREMKGKTHRGEMGVKDGRRNTETRGDRR